MNRLLLAVLLGSTLLAGGNAYAGRGSTFSAIDSAIRSGNPDSIISELERAEKLVCSRCVPAVRKLLDHDDYRVREAAAWWIAKRPVVLRQVGQEAEARLRGSDPILARNAADTLGTFQRTAGVVTLSQVVGRSDFPSSTRAAALKALGRIGAPEGEAAVILGLRDSGADARLAAVQAYTELRGTRDGAPLAALAQDPDANVRQSAVLAIGRYRLQGDGARVSLEQVLLHDGDPIARRNAAWALGRIGNSASRTALSDAAARDSISYVRSAAELSLRTVR